jgi:hypothetical protein
MEVDNGQPKIHDMSEIVAASECVHVTSIQPSAIKTGYGSTFFVSFICLTMS